MHRSVYDAMIAHARATLPEEAVGLLGGADAEVRRLVPLPNVARRREFLADPYAQYQAMRLLAAEGLEPLAVYHSHPGGGVRPSGADVRFASRVSYLQVIIALARPHHPAPEIAAYAVRGDAVHDVTIDVTAG